MKKNHLEITIWKSMDGWRWHMQRSGLIVAESGEAYERKGGATKTLKSILKAITECNYEIK